MFKQDVAQASLQSIVPDLAKSWSWNEDGTELTFPLHEGVRWHDGKPFTANDVVCTWNLLTDRSADKLRLNPRKSWYRNLEQATANGDYEVTFRLKRPQPSFLALLASGWSPVYPCHVPAREMRSRPIGTGPFKFAAFKPNESIVLTRNPDYWKKDRPYVDGIEYTIIPDVATRILAFFAGKFDVSSPYGVTIPLLQDVRSRAPQAVCEITSTNISRDLIISRAVPPFDNPDLRRAMALSLDRQAFIDILSSGQGDIGGAMLPPPEGIWGMAPEMLRELPGYDPDVQKNRTEARRIMNGFGYGTDHRLPIKLSTRNMAAVRDPAVLLIDQLKEIYIDGDSTRSTRSSGTPRSCARATRSPLASLPAASTTPTSNFTRITCAALNATTTATAVPRSTSWLIGNQWSRICRSAASWSGKSKESWLTTSRGRSSFIRVRPAAGSPMSRG